PAPASPSRSSSPCPSSPSPFPSPRPVSGASRRTPAAPSRPGASGTPPGRLAQMLELRARPQVRAVEEHVLRPLVRSNEAEPLVAHDTLDAAGHRAALVRSPGPLGKLRASFPRGDRPSQVHVDFLKLPQAPGPAPSCTGGG